MVIIEHKLQQLMKIADRIIVLNFGNLIADGPPEEVCADNNVIECYLGEGGK
jgi:branched-chain amino acid transport system ATP-binding protein